MKPLFFSILFALLLPAGFAHSQQHVFAASASNAIFGDAHNILTSIDLSNCISHYIDTLPIGVGTIAATPNGKLWAIRNNDTFGELYQVDTNTGHLTYEGQFSTSNYYVQSLCALNDSILLMQCHNDLYGLTTVNVHSFRIGSVGNYETGDMTWLGQNLYVIGCQNGTDVNNMYLLKVVFNNNVYPPIASAAPVSNTPSLPRCYGLATYILPNTDTALIGFADSNAYIINPANGSYTLYCSILPDSLGHFADAASISYPSVPIIIDTVNPNPTGVISPSNNRLMAKFYPNPVKDNLYINCPYTHAEFVLTDVAGKITLHETLKNGLNEINMRPFTSGLYFGALHMEKNIIYRRKIIKE